MKNFFVGNQQRTSLPPPPPHIHHPPKNICSFDENTFTTQEHFLRLTKTHSSSMKNFFVGNQQRTSLPPTPPTPPPLIHIHHPPKNIFFVGRKHIHHPRTSSLFDEHEQIPRVAKNDLGKNNSRKKTRKTFFSRNYQENLWFFLEFFPGVFFPMKQGHPQEHRPKNQSPSRTPRAVPNSLQRGLPRSIFFPKKTTDGSSPTGGLYG